MLRGGAQILDRSTCGLPFFAAIDAYYIMTSRLVHALDSIAVKLRLSIAGFFFLGGACTEIFCKGPCCVLCLEFDSGEFEMIAAEVSPVLVTG